MTLISESVNMSLPCMIEKIGASTKLIQTEIKSVIMSPLRSTVSAAL